jgi:uncharacterized protein YceK
MSGVLKISKMSTTKRVWLGFLAMAAVLMVAGCGSLTSLDSVKGPDSSAAGAQQTSSQMATPYSQPLMATGGDLAMLGPAAGVAAAARAC